MNKGARSLTVLVVAHNDAATLSATVERIYRALTITVEDFAIIIFDDGSTDDTFETSKRLPQQYPFVQVRHNDRRIGPGYCMIKGSKEAATSFLTYVPADNTWPLRSFVELFGNIGKADIITSYSTNLFPAMPPAKRFVSHAYSFILNALFGRNIHYYNGLTIYPTAYLRQDPVNTFSFGFQAEALIKAIAAGYSFLELPLQVDIANIGRRPSITFANLFNACWTILRLCFELFILRRATAYQAKTIPPLAGGQRGDELGAGESLSFPAATTNGVRTQRIVIVGASSGIGERLTHALSEDGHRLFICARRLERLAQIAKVSSSINQYFCDVANEQSVIDFANKLTLDTDGVDVLINAAGTFGEIGALSITDSKKWRQTLEVNLFGTYHVIKHLLPLLERGEAPRIINMAGGGAFSSFANYTAYACSKAAIVRLTECLADELAAKQIRINAIAPGFLATEMHKATLIAGEERAGRMQYQRTRAILEQGAGPMDTMVNCVRMMISPALDLLSGKTISSNFDPWQTCVFREQLAEITRSDLYTMRRVDVVNLPEGRLRSTLLRPLR